LVDENILPLKRDNKKVPKQETLKQLKRRLNKLPQCEIFLRGECKHEKFGIEPKEECEGNKTGVRDNQACMMWLIYMEG
jgi:hypothetical protein